MSDHRKPPLPSLEELQRKIDREVSKDRKEEDAPSNENAGQGMRLGAELVGGVLVGTVIGYFLDQWLSTMPLFFIVCFFLGAAAGFRNLLRDANRH